MCLCERVNSGMSFASCVRCIVSSYVKCDQSLIILRYMRLGIHQTVMEAVIDVVQCIMWKM